MRPNKPGKSYATFGLGRSWRQLTHALHSRSHATESMSSLLDNVRQHESRMEQTLGIPVENLRILEIGPGQGLERARYFSLKNEVVGLDLDVIPQGLDPAGYLHLIRRNGLGRFAKTVGRKVVIGNANASAWAKAIGTDTLPSPRLIHGDICQEPPNAGPFDVVMSWSVFEHLPHPRKALANIIELLNPGGILYISLHLYTACNGHHDIRAFTGHEDEIPPWAHLRPSKQNLVNPSSFLNEWRLPQWRELFSEMAPGASEYLEASHCREHSVSKMTSQLREELSDFADEELYTVDVIYAWKKPLVP
jgi:SAM-dependent methyltransferase